MKNYFHRVYQYLLNRGVNDTFTKERNNLIQRLNFISYLSVLGALFVSIIGFKLTRDFPYAVCALCIGLSYFFIPVFHHFKQYRNSRIYFSIMIPLAFGFSILFVGGNFAQELALAATAVLSYFLHKDEHKLRVFFLVYTCVCYFLPTLYISLTEPIMGVRDYPIDEIVVFFMCVGWLSIVFMVYDKRLKKYINSLEIQNTELEQKTAELERFTYIASHDLKSPLQNISNFISLISKETKGYQNKKVDKYLDFANEGAQTMNELIEGVLEISKSDKKIPFENLDKVSLSNALDKAISNLSKEIAERNVLVLKDDLPPYFCRETDFVIVFQNLIQNGIKYNKSQIPEIEINTKLNEDFIHISFKDNGLGIAKEYQTQVFEFFKRLHNTSEFPGTGLGLGLCKKLIGKYGGNIIVDSVEGSYSIFTIILPTHSTQPL